MSQTLQGFQGRAYHCLDLNTDEWIDEALLIFDTQSGDIQYFGYANTCPDTLKQNTQITELDSSQIILPGLIDLHVHLPQLMVTGCQAPSLLDWLQTFIFAEEEKFADETYAQKISTLFFNALLKRGTTTAAVFLTSHTKAANIAFETALKTGNRVIMGLNLMDKEDSFHQLSRETHSLLNDAETLCKTWHGKNNHRIQYAWMPRFALTSTPELLKRIGELRQKYPDTYFHTHLSEQPSEIEATLEVFPEARDYTDVYNRNGLLGKRSILAHSIHLSDAEKDVLHQHECVAAHCPGSNFFLKSGRFPLQAMIEKNIHVGLGSDVGAGPNLSIFNAMKETQYTQENWLIPLGSLFYLATLGAAKGLMLDHKIGNLCQGKDADFLIMDLSPLKKPALTDGNNKDAILSQLIYRGDDRVIGKTYIQGQCVYRKA